MSKLQWEFKEEIPFKKKFFNLDKNIALKHKIVNKFLICSLEMKRKYKRNSDLT